MSKKRVLIILAVIVAIAIVTPILAVILRKTSSVEANNMQQLTVWQIDGFEGGKGSRAQYLQKTGEKCFRKEKIYLTVTSISAEAARANFEQGEMPDMISYPSGFFGLENKINGKDFTFKNWCRGGYCILTTDENADFTDMNAQNTVINAGKDNLSGVAAVLSGLNGAAAEEPTNAYLKLIGGKCKYLFGTQRDVFRLKTRSTAFKMKPVTEFNDLYQNISILTTQNSRYASCKKYIDYLINQGEVGTLGLFGGKEICAEELNEMREVGFDFVLNYPCSENYITELKTAAKNGDVNKLKTLLK